MYAAVDEVSYVCLLGPNGYNVQVLCFPIDLCLVDLCFIKSGVLISTIIVLLSISPFSSVNICFIYLGAPLLVHAYIFVIYLSGKLTLKSLCNILCLLQ